ncbi:MAG: hypothetical protein KGJ38_06345 [Burkholderiaceae bacterium]|nr:hypothetical protein [Burkholderiaceae bacterium]
MKRTVWWKRIALAAAKVACLGALLAGCSTSREQYSQNSGVTAYGVVDAGIERTSR